jgi:putative hydrolase of the HAD superfamily
MDFLFDIGRVLLDFDFESSMRRLLQNQTTDSYNRLMQAIDRRNDLESGRIHPHDFIDQAIQTIDPSISREAFEAAWRNIFTPIPAMWEVVNNLKTNGTHRLILFSNTNAIHCPWVFAEFPQFAHFDGAVLSYEVGAMKPHAPIYEHAIREFSLDPSATLYIDDLPENIATGIQFGFRCHQYDFRNHSAFERWLATQLRL